MRIIQKFAPSYLKLIILPFSLLVLIMPVIGCGVKGDPIPPEKPPLLGRGQPAYKKATEEFKLPEVPQIIFEDEVEDDEEIESEE